MSEGVTFRLNKYMSRTRFEGVILSLHYTDKRIWNIFYMSQTEEARNINMAEKLNPSWINVLDENMMKWFNKYEPRLMCVGRKPHNFGNQRNTIFCSLTSILWRAQIVEDKYLPQ